MQQCTQFSSVWADVMSLFNFSNINLSYSSSEWDIIHVEIRVNNSQSKVATLEATRAELLKFNKSLLSKIRELATIVHAGQEIAAYYTCNTHPNTLCTTPIYSLSQSLSKKCMQFASTITHNYCIQLKKITIIL